MSFTKILFCLTVGMPSLLLAQNGEEPIKIEKNQPAIQNNNSNSTKELEFKKIPATKPAERSTKGVGAASFSDLSLQLDVMVAQYSHNRTRRTFTISEKNEMTQVLNQMMAMEPRNLKTLVGIYQLSQYDLTSGAAIEEAYKISPRNTDVQRKMALYCHLMNRSTQSKTLLRALVANGGLKRELTWYAKDMLLSCPQDGMLLVHAEEDALAVLYAQQILNVRTDVQVIALDWMNSPQFRQTLKAKGMRLPKGSTINVSFVRDFCALNVNQNLALSLTIPREYMSPILENLYLTGLVFRFRTDVIDVSDINSDLFVNQMRMELVKNPDHPIAANYLPFLLQLKQEQHNHPQLSESKLEAHINRIVSLLKLQSEMKAIQE